MFTDYSSQVCSQAFGLRLLVALVSLLVWEVHVLPGLQFSGRAEEEGTFSEFENKFNTQRHSDTKQESEWADSDDESSESTSGMILSNEMRVECSSKEAADFLCPCQRIADIARSQANLWPGWLMSSGGGAGYEGQTKFTVYRHKIFHFACGRAVIIQISY